MRQGRGSDTAGAWPADPRGLREQRTSEADPGGLAPFGFRRNEAKLIEADPS